MKRHLTNLAVMVAALVVGLGIMEGLSRVVMPLSPGARFLSLEGESITVKAHNDRFVPGLVFRLVASEFDVRVTITRDGNRVPAAEEAPEFVFVGDSFTFGHGLEDDETFAVIFCKELDVQCANIGRSGTGTMEQLDVLQHYLDSENWRPNRIKLFVLAMTGSLNEGNDLRDALDRRERHPASQGIETIPGSLAETDEKAAGRNFLEALVASRTLVLAHSNLARIVYYMGAGWLRATFTAAPTAARLQLALDLQRLQFQRLQDMAAEYGFRPEIYILHPMHDITRGTWPNTLKTVASLAGGIKIVSTANLFTDSISRYYYPYDGHFNPVGSRKVADFLIAEERRR